MDNLGKTLLIYLIGFLICLTVLFLATFFFVKDTQAGGFDIKIPNMQGFKIDSNLKLNMKELNTSDKRKSFGKKVQNHARNNRASSYECPPKLASRQECSGRIRWEASLNHHCRQHYLKTGTICYYTVMEYVWYDEDNVLHWCEDDAIFANQTGCPL